MYFFTFASMLLWLDQANAELNFYATYLPLLFTNRKGRQNYLYFVSEIQWFYLSLTSALLLFINPKSIFINQLFSFFVPKWPKNTLLSKYPNTLVPKKSAFLGHYRASFQKSPIIKISFSVIAVYFLYFLPFIPLVFMTDHQSLLQI